MKELDLNIRSNNIQDGVLDNMFGGYGSSPKVSFELEWDKVRHAESYALLMIDYDAVHVVGYPFIHWVVSDIKANKLELDATHLNKEIVQGQNSVTKVTWRELKNPASIPEALYLENANYTGPYPPDKTHTYKVIIYALDVPSLNLKPGFFLDDMFKAMKNHVLGKDSLDFEYKKN